MLAAFAFLPSAAAEAPGTWHSTTAYPIEQLGTSCATDGSYIYCVGGPGGVNLVYSAPISGSGIGAWTLQAHYPTNIYLPSCAISGGYIYCVGGLTSPDVITDAVYYAQLTSGSVGAWSSGTNYPGAIEAESCVISGGYITCVAGLIFPNDPSTITSAVYYAPVSGSGVGAWTETTDYGCTSSCQHNGSTGMTDNLLSCSASGGFITCLGGEYDMLHGFTTGDVFYDTLASGAVGATWAAGTAYPLTVAQGAGSCAVSGGYMYCVAGDDDTGAAVGYSPITSGSTGAWISSADYPIFVENTDCVISGGYMYCIGGETNISYYSQLAGGGGGGGGGPGPVVVCPSTTGGALMPAGAMFTDGYGNSWLAPSGNDGSGGYWSSYFFAGPQSTIPMPMLEGWGGVYGTYSGQSGWIITFYC